jgi:hypothetical protein
MLCFWTGRVPFVTSGTVTDVWSTGPHVSDSPLAATVCVYVALTSLAHFGGIT